MPRITSITPRGGTAAAWSSANPVLADREIGVETDTRRMKVGDGASTWSVLPYFNADWDDILDKPAAFPPAGHSHGVTDITGTGTKSSATYLRGDGAWATPTNTTYSAATQAEIESSTSTTARLITGQRMWQGVLKAMGTRSTTDWNNAIENGWHMGFNVPNQPVPGATWFMGTVVAHNSLYVTQTVHAFTADTAANTNAWRRSSTDVGGVRTWGAWYRLLLSQDELDARFAQLNHSHSPGDIGGTGKSSTTFLRGDGTWVVPPNSTYSVASQTEIEDAESTTARLITGQRMAQGVAKHVGNALSGLEPAIPAGPATHFLRGDKTWQPVPSPIDTFAALKDAVAAGGTITLTGTITVTESLMVTLPTKFIGGSLILPEDAGFPMFRVTSSDVTFDGLRITGPGSTAAYNQPSRFIYAEAGGGIILKNINVVNCKMVGCQSENIRYGLVQASNISNNLMDDYLFSGVMLLSCADIGVMNNTISNAILKAPVPNVYGIAATDTANTEAYRCRDIRIVGNTLRNIQWEAIDSHGGDGIIVVGNVITGCPRAVALVVGNASRTIVPINCVVQGNKIELGTLASGITEREGIGLFGLAGNLADAVITGNIIRGFSDSNAIYISAYINHQKTIIEGNSHPHIPWTDLAMTNTAEWTGHASFKPQYMVDGRTVFLRGFATSVTSKTTDMVITQLPDICKPDRSIVFYGVSHGSNSSAGTGTLSVDSTGKLIMRYRTGADFYSYPIEGSYTRAITT